MGKPWGGPWGAGLATSIFGVLESVRIRPNPTLHRIRPNPEPISVGSKCPYRLYNIAKNSPARLLGIRPNPSESEPQPNPSESRTTILVVESWGSHGGVLGESWGSHGENGHMYDVDPRFSSQRGMHGKVMGKSWGSHGGVMVETDTCMI